MGIVNSINMWFDFLGSTEGVMFAYQAIVLATSTVLLAQLAQPAINMVEDRMHSNAGFKAWCWACVGLVLYVVILMAGISIGSLVWQTQTVQDVVTDVVAYIF